jgi:hypothetical protein
MEVQCLGQLTGGGLGNLQTLLQYKCPQVRYILLQFKTLNDSLQCPDFVRILARGTRLPNAPRLALVPGGPRSRDISPAHSMR